MKTALITVFLFTTPLNSVEMVTIGTKAWCTVNTEWQITECLYDTQAECQRCAFVDGEGGLRVKEFCAPNPDNKKALPALN